MGKNVEVFNISNPKIDCMRISGCRKDTVYREGFVYQQMEITYSRFEKTIQFPAPIEGASLKHDYRDGFLIINLHRAEDA